MATEWLLFSLMCSHVHLLVIGESDPCQRKWMLRTQLMESGGGGKCSRAEAAKRPLTDPLYADHRVTIMEPVQKWQQSGIGS